MLVIFMLNRNNCKIGYIRYNDRKYERFKDKIANIFRRIFIKVIIENIDKKIARLQLTEMFAIVLKDVFELLSIEMPEKM